MLALILLTACQGIGGSLPHTGRQAGAPPPAPSQRQQQAWRSCGATATPPPSVLAVPGGLPSLTNATAGAVGDSTARAWEAGLLREQAIEMWAQTAMQSGLLQGGCLGDQGARDALFGDEIRMIQQATRNGAHILLKPPRILDVRLVTVPQQVQDRVRGLAFAKSQYALIVHGQGPAQTTIVYPGGKQENAVAPLPANQAYYTFFGGEYRAGADGVGPLWYQDSFLGCQWDFMRSICGT